MIRVGSRGEQAPFRWFQCVYAVQLLQRQRAGLYEKRRMGTDCWSDRSWYVVIPRCAIFVRSGNYATRLWMNPARFTTRYNGMPVCAPARRRAGQEEVVNNLVLILLFIFGGVALMVVLLERFGSPIEPEKMSRLSRWIMPLVGLMLVLSVLKYYMG